MNDLKQKLNWEVELKEIIIPGQKEPNRFALTRTDDNSLIDIKSNRYHPVYNKDLEAIKERVLDTRGFNFKGYQEFAGGKRILSFYENRRNDLQLCGQNVKDYLIIGNSHDSSSKLFIGTSNYMFRCENQFSEKIRAFEMRHDRPFQIGDIKIDQVIEFYELGRQKLYQQMEKLKDVKVDMQLVHRLAIKLMGAESRKEQLIDQPQLKNDQQTLQLLDCIETEIRELGPTLWGLFNGVTRYTSNHLKGKPGFGVVNGKGEEMNRKAVKMMNTIYDDLPS